MERGVGLADRGAREYLVFAYRLVLCTFLLSLVSYLAARAQPNQGYVPIWPSGGVGLALVWRHGARYWPAILASSTALSMSVGTPLLVALGVGWLQVLITMVALSLLHRWHVHVLLVDMRQLTRFLFALVIATSLSVPIYGIRMALVFQYPPMQALAFGADYFLSALLSFLIFAPLVVAWSARTFDSSAKRWMFAIGMTAIAVGGWWIMLIDQQLQDRLLFLMLPFVVLCALGAQIGGTSAAAALLTMIMAAMARTPVPVTDSILRTLFALIAVLTGYLVAAAFREREHVAAEMDALARHDALTGLMNRFEFENRVANALRDDARPYALMYLDLDQFKLVNDTCGHLAGDHMLRRLAATIENALPSNAVLARLGGDEFGCLLPDATPNDVQTVASRLHQAINSFEFMVGSLRFTVGVSIGTTFLSAIEDQSPDDVLARADVACYAAKEHGRNRTHAYDPYDQGMQGHHSEMQRISQLQSDLADGVFELHAQRIIDLRVPADSPPFYEILLRHAQGEPGETIESVIGMAQRYGLLAQIDRWVLDQAASYLEGAAETDVRLSINVGATTLESEGFERFVLALPARYSFDARRMVLEITEAVAVQNLTRAVETLRRFREHGFEISLDDFGTGVASFGYLSDLPVSMVKIDGRFVRDMCKDPTAEVVIESLARVASLRGISCVAEWVEDLAILPRLRALGVTYAQGYAIHQPEPLLSLDAVRIR
jgi:diguanylate cyclase (GGDEF)-like protein